MYRTGSVLSPSYIRLSLHVAVSLYCWNIIVTVQSRYHELFLIVVATLATKVGSLLPMQSSRVGLLYSWSAHGYYQALTTFNPLTDTWTMFVERVQLFLYVNTVAETKHVALDGKTLAVPQNLLAPEDRRRSHSKSW